MKYLIKRDKFLSEKLNERFDMSGSGPFGNDINWGDSLVGRLVNSIRRKVGIGSNLIRIESCIKQLKNSFDDIITTSSINSSSEIDKKKIGLILVYELLRIINIAIYNKKQAGYSEEGESMLDIKDEDYLKEINQIIVDTKLEIKEISITYGLDNESDIIKYIDSLQNKVKEMINSLESKENLENDEKSNNTEDKINLIFLENLKSVSKLYMIYSEMRKDYAKKPLNKEEDKPEYKTINIKDKVEESININENKNDILSSLKSLYSVINSEGSSESSNLIKTLNNHPSDKPLLVSTVNRLYKDIRKYINPSLVNEGMERILGKSSLSKSISNLYKISKKSNLRELDTNLKSELSIFIETMNKCLSPDLFKSNERKIIAYSSFLLINESEEVPNKEKKRITIDNQQEELISFWELLWDRNLSKVIKTKEEIERLKIEVEEIEEDESGNLIVDGGITGIDPVINIVKIFNRAYKLHTFPVIPGGRSGGKVTNRTFREYTSFGGGTPDSAGHSGGPYRNNRIFNKWESAILDIIRDSKYQTLFNKETIYKVGTEKRKGLGPKFLSFITQLLDGENLYKSGQQQKFIQEYFGTEVKQEKISFQNDSKRVNELSEKIKTSEVILENKKPKVVDEFKGTFFMTKGKMLKDGKEKSVNMFFHIQYTFNDNRSGIIYSTSSDDVKSLIRSFLGKKGISPSFKIPSGTGNESFITVFEKGVINKIIKEEEITLNGRIKGMAFNEKNVIKFKPEETKWLSIKGEEETKILKISDDDYNENWPSLDDIKSDNTKISS
jgi:hypothetical protein